MKAKYVIVMLWLALCHNVLAQPYHIRADANINLRTCAGIGCRIVEIVPPGTVLPVIGQLNRWLKVDRGGLDLWMADWVDYTRVESSPAESSSPQPQVDNCCYIDRQCQSEEDWIDGYHAFRNRECRLPLSSLAAGESSSQIDNCCFIGWLCDDSEDWTSGYHAFQNSQCHLPQGVIIEGSAGFVDQVIAGFNLLRDSAPVWYRYATGGLDEVRQTPDALDIHLDARTFDLNYGDQPPAGSSPEEHNIWTASIFVQGACYVYQHETGFVGDPDRPWLAALECTQTQLEAVQAIVPDEPRHRWIRWLQRVIENIEDPTYWWWAN